MKPSKPFKPKVRPYKTKVNAEGRVCTGCDEYKTWDNFVTANQKHTKIKKTAICKKCKTEQRRTKGRNYKQEKTTAKVWREHLRKVDPYLLKARTLRQGLMARAKVPELKATTPTTEQLYNWFLSTTPIFCYYSGVELNLLKKSNDKLTVDHKIPLARGGSNVLDNLCFASHHMNTAKGSMTETEFKALLDLVSAWEDCGVGLLRRLKQGHF